MDQIIIKKTCGNCEYWLRDSRIHMTKLCLKHNELTPVYCYCPLWAPRKRVLTVNLLKKYQLEK